MNQNLSRPRSPRPYSDEEVRIICEKYGAIPFAELAQELGRSWSSLSFKVRTLGLTANWRERRNCREWAGADIQLLRDLFPVMRTVDMVQIMGRTAKSIGSKAGQLGLIAYAVDDAINSRRGWKRRRPWTKDDVEMLRRIYADTHFDELVRIFGRSRASIEHKASALGVAKSDLPAELREVMSLKRSLVRRINEHHRRAA